MKNSSHLPFFMVSLPSRGPRTGSRVSSKFSIKTTSPADSALSIASRYLTARTDKLKHPPQSVLCAQWSLLPSLTDADHTQAFAVFVFDPLDALQLRIHHEGPALAGGENGGVLSGHPVCRKTLVLPRRNVSVVRQHGQRVQVRRDRDGNL